MIFIFALAMRERPLHRGERLEHALDLATEFDKVETDKNQMVWYRFQDGNGVGFGYSESGTGKTI